MNQAFYAKLMPLSEDDVHLTVNHELKVLITGIIKMASMSPLIYKTLAEFGITALLTDNNSALEIFSGELLCYLLHFDKIVTDKVEQIQRQLGLLNIHVPYLAVHIRTGFFGMEHGYDEGTHFNSCKA